MTLLDTANTTRTRAKAPAKPFLRRLLDQLVAADQSYREGQKLRRMDDTRLRDMGISRQAARRGGR